jgi:hypothetical protein
VEVSDVHKTRNIRVTSFGWRAVSCATRPPCVDSAGFHTTVFELSYLQRDGWNGAEHVWLWAAAGGSKSNKDFRSERFD